MQHERFLARTKGLRGGAYIALKRLATIGLCVLLCFVVIGTYRAYGKYGDSTVMREKMELERADFMQREEHLRSQLSHLETTRGKETLLRERYGLAKEGEQMIVIIDTKNEIATSTDADKVRSWLPSFLR